MAIQHRPSARGAEGHQGSGDEAERQRHEPQFLTVQHLPATAGNRVLGADASQRDAEVKRQVR